MEDNKHPQGQLMQIVRMNLGCGDRLFPLREGWINVDLIPPAEVVMDNVAEIDSFPYNEKEINLKTDFAFLRSDIKDMKNIATGSVHEIHAYHVIEHFHISELPQIISEIRRILNPDFGCLVVELPNILKCAKNLLQAETTKNPEIWHEMGLVGMFGDPEEKESHMWHKWGWYPESLSDVLVRHGFKAVYQQPAVTHKKEDRDFKLVAFMRNVPEGFGTIKMQNAPSHHVNPASLTGLGISRNGTNEALVVNPRDSVPQKSLLENIQTNMNTIPKWLQRTKVHTGKAFVVSAGPSLRSRIEQLKVSFDAPRGDKIFCVKHALPVLLEHGITPDFCVILDPRPLEGISTHGTLRRDLFKTIPKNTKFLVASMTNTDVTSHLMASGADIVGWHAYAAGIDRFISKGVKMLISGGTSAGMRTINIAYNMGFRDIVLIGFDSCMPLGWTPDAANGAEIDADGRAKYVEIYYKNPEVKYFSTGELVAQMQDIIVALNNPQDIIFDIWANGIIEGIWEENKQQFDVVEYSETSFIEPQKVV